MYMYKCSVSWAICEDYYDTSKADSTAPHDERRRKSTKCGATWRSSHIVSPERLRMCLTRLDVVDLPVSSAARKAQRWFPLGRCVDCERTGTTENAGPVDDGPVKQRGCKNNSTGRTAAVVPRRLFARSCVFQP